MGYFDIQVNGYGGIDFNQDNLRAEELHQACQLLQQHGVKGILATIITEHMEVMMARIRRLVHLRERDPLVSAIIRGIHIEGPFLSPEDGYRGAHPADAIIPADPGKAQRLVEAGGGLVRVFTLAPEMDKGGRTIRCLARSGIRVSAGHTNASLDELRNGIVAGLSLFTHLGNGCPSMMPRHDNIIQRALSLRNDLCLCFIADGVHIPFPALRNYLDLALQGAGCLVTTDAMAAAGLGRGIHRIGRWEVAVKEDLAAWAPDGSHLLGSAMSMPLVEENLRSKLGLDEPTIDLLLRTGPESIIFPSDDAHA